MKQPFVIIIFGASGSGKSTLMELMSKAGNQYSIHTKTTDRPPREYDDFEIVTDPNFNPADFDYVYQTYGHRYGISAKQIIKSLENNQHHFIICNDISTIKIMIRDFGDLVKVIFHYFDGPKKEIRKIQEERNISDDEINLRLAKISLLHRQFIEEWRIFNGVLTNNFGKDTSLLWPDPASWTVLNCRFSKSLVSVIG